MTALSVRWVRRLVVLVGVVVCGVGCGGSGPEVAAIPSVVPADSESWVCPGVPAKSVMLVTGDDPVVSAASDPDYGWWACSASTTTLGLPGVSRTVVDCVGQAALLLLTKSCSASLGVRYPSAE